MAEASEPEVVPKEAASAPAGVQEGVFAESLKGFYEQTKAATLNAAERAKIAARKAQLMGEIQWLERKLKQRKQKFGEDVFEPLANNEHAEVDKVLAGCKQEIDELNDTIGAKRAELELLRAGINP